VAALDPQRSTLAVSYNLYITRASDWANNGGREIRPEEWLALVRDDPELTPDRRGGPYFARWAGPSRHTDPWLDWADGNVYSKYPDSALLRKMSAVADRLGASIQGENGEVYLGDEPLDEWLDAGEGPVLSTMEQTVPRPVVRPEPRQPWWKRLFRRPP
jgi:hypothetical protein